ncbi:phage baseplate protein [Oleispirillum naphthae]|uniref:phage baseplate protein n=1 Tax=Oleispirillum naphthae TaxID=2838853 RepID=UPI003082497D
MTEHITIGDIRPRIQYTADGAVTDFTFPFPVFADGDLLVYLGDTLQTSGYTVSGAGESAGGTAVFAAAPAAGTVVTLTRMVPEERTTDFQEGGAFRATVINEELDRIVCMVQQLREDISRSVVRPVASTSTASLALPDPAAGKALKWNAAGDALANSAYDPDAAQAEASVARDAALAARSAAEAARDTASVSAASAAEAAAGQVSTLLAGYVADAMDAAVLAEEARDATLDAFDSFDDRYLGAKDADPSADNDGDTLTAGALYFNSAAGAMRLWTGSAWVAAYVQGGDFIEKDRAWPIGSIYVNAANATSPAVLLGFGTWEAIGQGRVLIGVGTGSDGTASRTVAAGETGGEYAHALTEAENGPHAHAGTAASAGAHSHTLPIYAGGEGSTGTTVYGSSSSPFSTSSAGAHTHALTIETSGSGAAHNNAQPYLGVYMWVRTA